MPTPYTSTDLNFVLNTPLGPDELLVASFSGHEEISGLFSFTVDLLSENDAVDFDALVGEPVCLALRLPEGKRYISGHAARFSQLRQGTRFTHYRLEIVPWLWFLTRTWDCRIFQGKTVPEIVQQIFDEKGFSGKYELQLSGSYEPREYCVQYRETDYNFVARLLEEEGIFSFFRHEEDDHKLVLADAPVAHKPIEPAAELEYSLTAGDEVARELVTEFAYEKEVRPDAVTLQDYNFTTPSTSLEVSAAGENRWEIYDYPGRYPDRGRGEAYAKRRLQVEEARVRTVQGSSTSRRLVPGFRFDLVDHPRAEFNATYTIVSVLHSANQEGEFAGAAEADVPVSYSCEFECLPHEVPFRPAPVTPKPRIAGCQTALVVGPGGEEIWVDKYGRVKVHFYWDRESRRDDKSSCWVRVSQNWAGKNWGVVFHPRIGQEVVVDFLEGDPDRPIIVGRVYNDEQMPPYELPANSTQSTVKSRSSKGGGPANFNEIRFEDKKGEEELYIHAEKDQNTVVENDRTQAIGRDKTETVGRNKSIEVAEGHTEQIGSAMSITVGGTLTETVGLNYAETVGGAMEVTVGGLLAVTVGAAMSQTVGGALAESVGMAKAQNIGGNKTVNVGKSISEKAGEHKNVTVVKDLKEQVGGQHQETVEKDYILNAKKVQIVAKDEIKLKTGKAEVILKKNGDITIKGKTINVKGSGDVVIKGSQIKEN